MKYIQFLILGFLVLSAALLFEIYRSQRAEPVPVEQPSMSVIEEAGAGAADPGVPGEVAAVREEATPAPVKPKPTRQTRQSATVDKTPERPAPEPPAGLQSPVASAPPPAEENPIAVSGQIEPERPTPSPEPRRVTIPAGSQLVVRLSHSLSTARNLGGDTFYAHLDEPLVADDMVIAEKGARVEGRVLEVQRAGRVKGLSKLSIELVRLNTADGQTVEVVTSRMHRQGDDSKGGDAKKVGIGAAAGAIIGAIAGGGKGAAIGAGVGAGAGGGAVAATRGRPAEIPSETRLTFRLLDPVEIVERL